MSTANSNPPTKNWLDVLEDAMRDLSTYARDLATLPPPAQATILEYMSKLLDSGQAIGQAITIRELQNLTDELRRFLTSEADDDPPPESWLDVLDDALCDLSTYAPDQYTPQVEIAHGIIQGVLGGLLDIKSLLETFTDKGYQLVYRDACEVSDEPDPPPIKPCGVGG